MRSGIILLVLTLLYLPLGAQEVKSIISAGDRLFDNEDYFKASNYYLIALEKEPRNTIAKYRLAETYRLITNYQEAELLYGEVLKRSESIFPLARYYYALTQKFNGKYREAVENFELFLKNIEAKRYSRLRGNMVITFSEQARIELEGCLLALEALARDNVDHDFHLLTPPVNTEFNDYAAYTYHHDSTIVITSARSESKGSHLDNRFGESLTDLFRYEFTDGNWAAVSLEDRFDKEINSKFHDGSGVFNQDFSKFYFTHCAPDTGCEIYFTEVIDGLWQEPYPLNTNINKPRSDSMHPSLTASGDTLFFTSDRAGGLGGFDIWMSVFRRNRWNEAVNLGDYINTAFREISPFYDAKGNTLFFASDGHLGHGGLDVLMAENIFDASTEVFNMGIPYNSSSDDAFFTIGEKGGFLSSNRQGGIGNFDIYTFEFSSDTEIINEIINSKQLASRNSIFVTDYAFDNPDIKKIEGVVSNLLASRIHGANMPFSTDQRAFYTQLSEADKIRVERIVNSRMKSTNIVDLQLVRHEDEFFYQQIAGDFKYYVDRMVSYFMEDYELQATVQIPPEDKAFFEDLNANSKNSIDRFIALKLNEYENINLDDEYYSNSSPDTKQKIDDISKSYLKAKVNLSSLDLADSEASFLEALDEEDRKRTELSIANQVASLSYQNDFQLSDTDRNFYQKLSDNEKSSLDKIAQAYIQSSVNNLEDYLKDDDLNFFNKLKPKQRETFDKLLAKRIQNFVKADKYTLDALPTEEIEHLLDISLARNRQEPLSYDSTEFDNSLLREMAKEDQDRFSRLLASATNLIMLQSSNRVQKAALELEKRETLQGIIENGKISEIGTLNDQQKIFLANLTPDQLQFFQELLTEKSYSVIKDVPTDSLGDTPFRIDESLMSTFSPKSIFENRQRIRQQLTPEEQNTFATALLDATNFILKENKSDLLAIRQIDDISLSTLVGLKEPQLIDEATVETSVLPSDSTEAITKSVIKEAIVDSELQTLDSSIDQPNRSLDRSTVTNQVKTLVNSSKRAFNSNLSLAERNLYTSLTPLEKRFIDQALTTQLSNYVMRDDIALEVNRSNQSDELNLNQKIEQDFSIAIFNANPDLRRALAPILKKSSEDRKELEALMAKNATFVITNNYENLKGLSNPLMDERSAKEEIRPTVKEEETVVYTPEEQEVIQFVIQTKPNYVKDFTANEMSVYMKFSAKERAALDQILTKTLANYVQNEEEIISSNDSVFSKLPKLTEMMSFESLTTRDDKVEEVFGALSKDQQLQLSNVLIAMGHSVVKNEREALTTLHQEFKASQANDAKSSSEEINLSGLNNDELQIINQMSSEERRILEKLLQPKTRVDSPDLTSETSNLDAKEIEINSSYWQGKILTIQVIESDSVDSETTNYRMRTITDMKVGQTKRVIWSEKDQKWYQIEESGPKKSKSGSFER